MGLINVQTWTARPWGFSKNPALFFVDIFNFELNDISIIILFKESKST